MQNSSKTLQFSIYLLLLGLVFLMQCQKDPAINGDDIGDNLERIDSLKVVSFTVQEEIGDAKNQNDVALGRIVDARFGESLASFYAQLRLTTNSFTPGSNAILDSVALVMVIESVYGPMQIPLDIEVYRLTEALDNDLDYKTDLSLTTGDLIGGVAGYTYEDDATRIRIPLTSTFGNEIFALFGSTTMESSDNFIDYLKGIYVSVDGSTGGDGHLDLDLTSASTSLNLYFRSDNASDSIYSFLIDAQALRLNQYQNSIVGSELEIFINDNSNDDENILLAGLNVSIAKVYWPDLSFLKGAVINQARLSFYQSDYNDPSYLDFDVPEYLFLTGGIAGDSVQYTLTDYSSTDPTKYGGTKVLTEVNGGFTNVYSYSIPRFIQRVVDGETSLEYFNLEVLNSNNGARIQLGGGTHPDLPIKLEILYTKP